MKKGISLIVLIITIIVIVILAGAIVLNLSDTNIIEQANNAVGVSNLKNNEEAFVLYKADLFVQTDGEFDKNNLSIVGEDLVYDTNGDGETTPNISKALNEVFPKAEIVESIDENGGLVQTGSDSEPVGTSVSSSIVVDSLTVATVHSTIDGNIATSTNPIIPKGFKPVNAVNNAGSVVADWNDLANNYNKGVVIQDSDGNQFVWIPVNRMGTPGEKVEGEVTYNKWCSNNISYDDPTISDDTLPSEVTSENTQITSYGGFYVARYEGGKQGSILVSKDNATVWDWINYTDSKSTAEGMYNDSNIYGVRSGLLTGTMRDTMLDYLYEYHGKTEAELDVNSSSWGNYSDSSGDADISGHNLLQKAGYSDYWQAGNIYDIAGNMSEWTSEIYDGTKRILRGGAYINSSVASAGIRSSSNVGNAGPWNTIRVALFIQPE